MHPGERYYLIERKDTGEYLEDWDGTVFRFKTKEEAMREIAEIEENTDHKASEYEIVCARW